MSYGQYSSEHREVIPARPDLTKKQTPKREKHVFGSGDTSVSHVWATPLQKDESGYYQTYATNPQKNFYRTDRKAPGFSRGDIRSARLLKDIYRQTNDQGVSFKNDARIQVKQQRRVQQ